MNPRVGALYAVAALPVHASPYWLIHTCSIGRAVNFSLLWLAAYLVASQLAELAIPFIIITLLVLSPAASGQYANSELLIDGMPARLLKHPNLLG